MLERKTVENDIYLLTKLSFKKHRSSNLKFLILKPFKVLFFIRKSSLYTILWTPISLTT